MSISLNGYNSQRHGTVHVRDQRLTQFPFKTCRTVVQVRENLPQDDLEWGQDRMPFMGQFLIIPEEEKKRKTPPLPWR
jgi:hypothetical protein